MRKLKIISKGKGLNNMVNTVLLDLDGTLASLDADDTEVFTKNYFKDLSIKLKDFFTLEDLTKVLWTSTKHMRENPDGRRTNEEIFFEKFYGMIEHSKEDLQPLIDDFYENDFYKVEQVNKQNDNMMNAVNLLKEKNYELVVASNPMFPKTAMIDRVKWAGFKEEDFKYITSFECMHYCKPHLEFFGELLEIIDKDPKECLMVGNHAQEDMIAKEIGISTYLIKDYASGDLEDDKNIDYSGYYKEFYEFVKELPDLSKDN